jgi:hypothetical protein
MGALPSIPRFDLFRNLTMKNVLAYSFGVNFTKYRRVVNGPPGYSRNILSRQEFWNIMPRNLTVPNSRTAEFYPASADQDHVFFFILCGECTLLRLVAIYTLHAFTLPFY